MHGCCVSEQAASAVSCSRPWSCQDFATWKWYVVTEGRDQVSESPAQIDMDTIETSNLNRQFLFRRKHVGQSKAKVAAETVRRYNPRATIVAHQARCKANHVPMVLHYTPAGQCQGRPL